MYRNLSEFIARLEREGELQRVSVPVDPVYEIAEITDRMSKQPDGGKALLFEQTGTPFPVLTNMMGSDRRMAMALGVESLDELTRRLDDLLQQAVTPKNSLLDKLRMLPLLAEMSRWLPRTSSSRGECQQVVLQGGGGVARCAAGAQVLAVRRRTLRDAAAGAHPRSRNGNPQRGHVPAATV